jgi:hypothetical protein
MKKIVNAATKWAREQILANKPMGWFLVFLGITIFPTLFTIVMLVWGIVLINQSRSPQPRPLEATDA